jgi:hypothetical protein
VLGLTARTYIPKPRAENTGLGDIGPGREFPHLRGICLSRCDFTEVAALGLGGVGAHPTPGEPAPASSSSGDPPRDLGPDGVDDEPVVRDASACPELLTKALATSCDAEGQILLPMLYSALAGAEVLQAADAADKLCCWCSNLLMDAQSFKPV